MLNECKKNLYSNRIFKLFKYKNKIIQLNKQNIFASLNNLSKSFLK